jgi:hypothetical protein
MKNRAGLYRHPDTGAEVFVKRHPKLGSAMADGVVAQGYVWVSDKQPKELARSKYYVPVDDFGEPIEEVAEEETNTQETQVEQTEDKDPKTTSKTK